MTGAVGSSTMAGMAGSAARRNAAQQLECGRYGGLVGACQDGSHARACAGCAPREDMAGAGGAIRGQVKRERGEGESESESEGACWWC
jgi:hypothetical protein